ncbi:MAG: hypothetical protein P4L53_14095 [Candidatus Obscuribacterales bacterium]|nr:hypothetical protein [Candidatus Obscuribacterales bacterium]
MSAEIAKDVENKQSSLSEFAGAFFDASVRAPIASARHLFGGLQTNSVAESHSVESVATRAGHLAGEAFDVMVVSAVAGKVIKGIHFAESIEHLAVTESNNPISKLGRALPHYFETLDTKEALLQGAKDSAVQRSILKEQIAHKADFAHDLMNLWHGTTDVPGIAQFSDAELATTEFPAAKVSQVRAALKLPAPEMSQSLFKLTFPQGQYDQLYDLSHGMLGAKQRYYRYDLYDVADRMSMPEVHRIRDSFYDTPLSWMPTKASSAVPGFFHGTISSSLDSIVAEKAILPSNELRARGIEHNAGETAAYERGKDDVSITRDFKEAWAYQLQNPQYIDSYPIVYGVSRQAASRAQLVGPIEPGEILIDQLHLDETVFSKISKLLPFNRPKVIGQGSAERALITHMYVPDAKVAEVSRKLENGRVRGVSVTGLSDLKTPQWTDEPPLTEAELW